MWPRTEEDKKSKLKNSGFVCYLDRKDAEVAKDEMHGLDDNTSFSTFVLFIFVKNLQAENFLAMKFE